MAAPERWVGKSLERFEDAALLTGRARFMDDLEPAAGLCHAAILRSQHGCADIRSIDVSAALALPGVIGVLAPDDVAAMSNPIGNMVSRKLRYYPCAVDRTRYFGEPIAVVVAESRYIAEDAVDLIAVNYDPKPAVVTIEDALASGSTVLHEDFGSNVVHERTFRYGDPEGEFAKAARIVACTVDYPRVNSTPIETYGVIADFDAGNGRYTVWSNFQGPYAMHPLVCDALRVRGQQLRLISSPSSGGSFGIKHGVYPYIVLIGLASRKVGRPVKWIEDRVEHLAASSAATGRATHIDGAFDGDGRLLALRLKQTENVGAYLRPPDPASLYRMHSTLSGPYRVRHIAVENKVVVTNQVPSGLNRGFGGPQFYYPLERMMDLAAKEIGIDPVELRLRNVVQTFPYETPAGSLLESGNYRRCIELALERAGYRELMAQRESARKEGRMFGIGMALAVETSASNMAYVNLALTQAQRAKQLPKSGAAGRARVIMDPLGAIIVHVDSLPNGQGHRTVVAQIVADEIGVNPEDVEVITDLDTFGGAWSITSGNYSNRFSTVVVSAVAVAARMAARKLRAAAAKTFGVEPGTVQLLSGMASAPGAGNEPVPIRRLAMQLHWDAGDLPEGVDGSISELAEFSPDTMTVPDEDDRMRSSLTYSFQCDLAGVEVNAETGRVQVHKYVSAHDAGTLLNPAVVEGQLRGGFAHGFGAAMLERVTYAADGTLLSGTFQDYLCPTAPELPDLGIAHYATPSPNTIQGAKGLGDGCSMIAPVAMANAIGDATGLRDLTPPFLPGRLWQLLHGGDPDLALTRPSSAPQDETGRQLSGTLRGRGTIAIEVARQKVWDALLDPVQLRAIIPGCQNIEQTSPDTFSAQIRVSIAGIGALYEAQIRIFDRKEPERLKLAARGESKLGFGQGEALVTLEETGAGVTQLTYEYGADVGGRVATFGQRMLDGVVKVVLADFFDRLRAHVRGEKPRGAVVQRLRRLISMLQAFRGRS